MLLSAEARSQESGPPPSALVREPEDIVHSESRPAGHTIQFVVETLLSHLAKAEVERIVERCATLVGFTKPAEPADDATFAALTERHMRLREFTRRLEDEQTARENRDFDAHVERFLRETAFLKQLILQQNAARAESRSGGPPDSARWNLYTRD